MAAVSGEGEAVVGVTLGFSDVSLESDDHSFLIESGVNSWSSLADLLPCVWRGSALGGFAIVSGQRGKEKQAEKLPIDLFSSLCFLGRLGKGCWYWEAFPCVSRGPEASLFMWSSST